MEIIFEYFFQHEVQINKKSSEEKKACTCQSWKILMKKFLGSTVYFYYLRLFWEGKVIYESVKCFVFVAKI